MAPIKFRKKPVVIEAFQFVTNNEAGDLNMNQIVKWITENGGQARHNRTDIFIKTLEGEMLASCGDWMIRGVAGEFYPCKPDIFAATYEKVQE
jgi:hypothetical protein